MTKHRVEIMQDGEENDDKIGSKMNWNILLLVSVCMFVCLLGAKQFNMRNKLRT